jgi:cellobiose phosphorylase
VRTKCSDDYVWLPYAAARYVLATGDTGLLNEVAYFLEGRELGPEEESYYDLPARSTESATLYQHCVRALKRALGQGPFSGFGEHGLPLIGSGDWNDGMDRVGIGGKGESVWLAFFLYDTLTRFAELAKLQKDDDFAADCLARAAELRANIEKHAWDGQWYRRAYFDNGEPLGSAGNPECQIDLLPQSWAAITQAVDGQRTQQALAAADERLVDRDARLIRVFDPPFDTSHLNPGYVKGYLPGVRENGGQYTHSAVWAAMAFAAVGDAAKAWELFSLINPISHGDSEEDVRIYQVEPYVVAADVYTNPQHVGRGGWTWYTGSAGWMYRLLTESLLGLRLEVDHLRFEPLLPDDWPQVKIHYRFRETFYHITMHRHGDGAVTRVLLDGQERPELRAPLVDDRRDHQIEVDIGERPTGTDEVA